MSVEQAVRAALGEIYDPCSVAAGAPLSLPDMGMITALDVDSAGTVALAIRPTSLMCTLVAGIIQGIHERLEVIQGVTRVDVRIDAVNPWSEDELTDEGKAILARRRDRSRAEVPVRPQEWKYRAIAAR